MSKDNPETSKKPFPIPCRSRPSTKPGMLSNRPKIKEPMPSTTRPVRSVPSREKVWESGATRAVGWMWGEEVGGWVGCEWMCWNGERGKTYGR